MDTKEHLLVCLAEECAEVQQAVAKALRFGLGDGYPGTDRTNEGDLFNELNDLFAVVEMLHDVGIWWRVDSAKVNEKKARTKEFMQYAEQRGTLNDPCECCDRQSTYLTYEELHAKQAVMNAALRAMLDVAPDSPYTNIVPTPPPTTGMLELQMVRDAEDAFAQTLCGVNELQRGAGAISGMSMVHNLVPTIGECLERERHENNQLRAQLEAALNNQCRCDEHPR